MCVGGGVTSVPRLNPSMEMIRGLGVAEFGDNVMVIRCSMKRAVRVRVPLISDQAEVECHRGR